MTVFTRRKMLTVTAATAASAAAVANLTTPAAAEDAQERDAFKNLSGALTGIHPDRLAPIVDPIQIITKYIDQAKSDPGWNGLMQIARAESDPAVAAGKVMNNADPKIKYLGRSIILMWYLGTWFDPKKLEAYNSPKSGPFPLTPEQVVSPAAYTQGWVWRVAQTHPMGYSEMLFGYWSNDPPALDAFIK